MSHAILHAMGDANDPCEFCEPPIQVTTIPVEGTGVDTTAAQTERDRSALANLIPLGFKKKRDGVADVFEAADRILESEWLSDYVGRHVCEALAAQAVSHRIEIEHLRGEAAVAKAQRGGR